MFQTQQSEEIRKIWTSIVVNEKKKLLILLIIFSLGPRCLFKDRVYMFVWINVMTSEWRLYQFIVVIQLQSHNKRVTRYKRLNLHEDVEEVCSDMSTPGGMLNAVRSGDFDWWVWLTPHLCHQAQGSPADHWHPHQLSPEYWNQFLSSRRVWSMEVCTPYLQSKY